MLHATHRHKTKLPYQRYAMHRELGDDRRTQEDEITSTIFGPLDFMQKTTANRIVNQLLEEDKDLDSDVTIEFWPRIANVEPDVLITRKTSAGVECYIVEIKWNAPLGETQIQDQVNAVKSERHPDKLQHMVISRFAQSVETPSTACTWMDFKDRFVPDANNGSNDSVFEKWRKLVTDYLETCNVRHFCGFKKIKDVPELSEYDGFIFWEGWKGWDGLDTCQCSSLNIRPIFWEQ